LGLKDGYRQNVTLVGNRYVGKSAILQNFFANFDDDDITVIYLDLENKDFYYFFKKFTGSLLYNFAKNKRLPTHDNYDLLLESVRQYIPHTVEVINKIRSDIAHRKFTDSFLGMLTLPEIYTNETEKFCVLILDEFQNLGSLKVSNIFQLLGNKIMTQKRCLYLMASSYPGVARRILSEKLSLLFGNFEIVEVDPFDLKSSQEFIDYKLTDIKIGAQLKNFLTDFTGGHPLYLNLICNELISLSAVYKQGEIYMPLLAQSIENTIFNRWGVISRHFELIINDLVSGKGNESVNVILMEISNGKHKLSEIVDSVELKVTRTRQKLKSLLELGIVVKNGNFYYFKDKLFKYWIKYVYQRRLKSIEFSPQRQKKQFKEEFNQSVERFRICSFKDFPSRITELLYCFDNEAFHLNGRKYKVPTFRHVVPVKFTNDRGRPMNVLKATTQDSLWLIIAKKDNLLESDLVSFLQKAKQTQTKPERCLIISLAALDENAKLKALQERFWIWSEGELNTLLTLFDKPLIVR
jgi:hypothetical protein